jgi:hypothetical protein
VNTFSLNELHALLVQRSAFLGHCAGFAKGVGDVVTNSYGHLERLQKAATEDFELSCSTIRPGDGFDNGNYTGKVGLVLCPRQPDSITYACFKDGGTGIDPTIPGRRKHVRISLALNDIERAIDDRTPGRYNELCVLDYEVRGVFCELPIQYIAGGELENLTLADVANAFPGHALFRVFRGQLQRFPDPLRSEAVDSPTPVSTFYP